MDSYPPCPFCGSTAIQREKHPKSRTFCGNCRRELGDYDRGIIPTFVNFDLRPLQHAYQKRDWETVAIEFSKINEQTAGALFIDRARRAVFGDVLRELGCRCAQVLTIVADANGVGCEECQVVLFGEPFKEFDDVFLEE